MSNKPMKTFDPFTAGEAIIRVEDFEKGRTLDGKSSEGMLVAVLSGKLSLEADGVSGPVPKGYFVFIPPGMYYTATFLQDASLAFFSLEKHIGFCEDFLFPRLSGGADKYHAALHGFTFLKMDSRMKPFMDSVVGYLGISGMESRLFDLKVEELFFLFDTFYSKEELSAFFQPLLSPNASFTYFILRNYDKVRTVIELAERSSLSLSAFEKEFRRVFETSPHRWMRQKKAVRVLDSIRFSGKPFKQISEEFGFPSTTQLSDFCRKEWGMPPGKLRSGMPVEMMSGGKQE